MILFQILRSLTTIDNAEWTNVFKKIKKIFKVQIYVLKVCPVHCKFPDHPVPSQYCADLQINWQS